MNKFLKIFEVVIDIANFVLQLFKSKKVGSPSEEIKDDKTTDGL